MKVRTLAVNAKLTRFHCSIKATRWRQFMQHSRNVFHNGGDGKHCAQANSHICKASIKQYKMSVYFSGILLRIKRLELAHTTDLQRHP